MIQFKDVTKSYPLHPLILNGVNLNITHGEKVVLLGPSGCGKSTLLRCINHLESISSGELWVNGLALHQIHKDEHQLQQLRLEVGMVFQSFNLFPHLTVLDNLILAPTKVKKTPVSEAQAIALDLLERVGLSHKKNAMPQELSGGQQQRVAIARGLAMKPKVLLFDEPTSALDPEMVTEVLDVMTELADEAMSMIVVTHEMGFARKVADRILFMDQGKIIEDKTPDHFFESPETLRAQSFLSKILSH
jgi:ABC-type polar amino acid transport system ATPase subunit